MVPALGGGRTGWMSRCTMVWCFPWQFLHLDKLLQSAVLCPGAKQLKQRWCALRWSDLWLTVMPYEHRVLLIAEDTGESEVLIGGRKW